MENERRRHPRVARPMEGTWHGGSGALTCRIADISLGGCFVQSLSEPEPGEHTFVELDFDGHRLRLPGRVVYAEPDMGFAVEFENLDEATGRALERLLTQLTSSGRTGPSDGS